MSTQEINYTQGSDTGERDPASVAPINPGEKVKAAIFDRPIDNLRNRSEVLRDEVIDQKYLQDTDIMWLIADGDAVTGLNPGMDLPMILWDPVTGTFVIGPFPGVSMVLQPIKTPGHDTVTLGGEDVVYTFVTDTITITSFLRNYAGGNRREVRWVWDAGITGTALAFLSGSPNHILTIHVASDGTTQVTDVDNALLALGASLGAAGFAHGVTGGGDLIAAVPADHAFTMIHEREMHRIPQGAFAAFFATHFLSDGDTLAIWYDQMAEIAPGIGGRRQSCPTNGNITLTDGQLFITTQEPEKIPIGIPICKRIGNDLIFLDGTVCYGNAPGGSYPIYTGEHGYTVNRIIEAASTVLVNITNTWANALPVTDATGTINQALNGIVGDLANTLGGTCGALRVGARTVAGTPDGLVTDSVGEQLEELLLLTNARIRTIHPTATSASWVLLWRSNNIPNDAAVTRSTTSLYWKDGEFSLVTGAYWSSPTQLRVGVGGVGNVQLTWWIGSSGNISNAVKLSPADGDVILAAVTTAWDSLDLVGQNASMWGVEKLFQNIIRFYNHTWFYDDIHHEEDIITYRNSPSDNDWHLVYRNDGVINDADVKESTYSVYEKVGSGLVSRMEVYGAYLDGAALKCDVAGTSRSIWFRYTGNGAGVPFEVVGYRNKITSPFTLSWTNETNFDYHWNFGSGDNIKVYAPSSPPPADRISPIFLWHLRQHFEREVEINAASYLNANLQIAGEYAGSPVRLKGTPVPALDIYRMFEANAAAGSDHAPSIWYDDGGLWITTNANWNNNIHQWSCVDVAQPATAIRITALGITFYQKSATAAVWSSWVANDVSNFSLTQLASVAPLVSSMYRRDTLASGASVDTGIPYAFLQGLIIVTATFTDYGGSPRRTALFRCDVAGPQLVSGRAGIGPVQYFVGCTPWEIEEGHGAPAMGVGLQLGVTGSNLELVSFHGDALENIVISAYINSL